MDSGELWELARQGMSGSIGRAILERARLTSSGPSQIGSEARNDPQSARLISPFEVTRTYIYQTLTAELK